MSVKYDKIYSARKGPPVSRAPSPTVRRRRLGVELRRLREAAGLTGDQVVERVGWASSSKVSRMENGRSRPDLADVLALLDLYRVTGRRREQLVAIARDAGNTRGWLRAYPVMTPRQREYAELEAGCSEIREYGQLIVPGLLQTPEYARCRIVGAQALGPAPFHPAPRGIPRSRVDQRSRVDGRPRLGPGSRPGSASMLDPRAAADRHGRDGRTGQQSSATGGRQPNATGGRHASTTGSQHPTGTGGRHPGDAARAADAGGATRSHPVTGPGGGPNGGPAEPGRGRAASAADEASGAPNAARDHGDIDTEVAARSARQGLLMREPDPPRYDAVLEESALTGRAAPPEVLAEQLEHLCRLARLPHVTLRLLPPHAVIGDWYVPATSFSIYQFTDPEDPGTVAIETLGHDVQLSDNAVLRQYLRVFDWLREAARTPEESLRWLAEAAAAARRAAGAPTRWGGESAITAVPPVSGGDPTTRPAAPPTQRGPRQRRVEPHA